MDARIEVALLLILFTWPAVVKIGTYRVRYGKMPIGISERSSGTERFLAGSLIPMVSAHYALGVAYLWKPDVLDALRPFEALENGAAQTLGLVVGLVSLGLTGWAQATMGEAWKIGIDRKGVAELVKHGPFRWIRNPIYTGMMGASLGFFLLVPCDPSLVLVVLTVYALQLQARLEEDFLRDEHGDAYAAWVAITGRFLPRLGAG